ncbi:hypothetical protein G5B30_15295 [Sphingobacterium sp. SGG-5]|uniref:hypothetical protein n=1 Tax=Sphingobacterium sp. SGG-5 TaxID=2710881 RepID=UPI0013EC431F|nr:hypothetical protein [Sphingobacterium sp. SGG-5]NGM63273.1 hypothetical protein [Sphingobacterium sp. SGG-5]
MSKTKFLLVSPQSFNLYQLIVKNLEHLGYDVVHIEDHGYAFKYTSLGQRIYNFIRKTFFKDRIYKEKLKQAYTYKKQQEILATYNHYDVALVLRADFFQRKLIDMARQKTDLMLCFHFDGISRDPQILKYIPFFDRFYVFDEGDVVKYPSYNLLYSPNFYFDYPDLTDKQTQDSPYNVYYVSTFHESRAEDLITLHQYMSRYYQRVKFVVVTNRGKEHLIPDYIHENMEIRFEHVPFDEQLHHIAHADVIIDLVIADHKGYSFRIIEGLKFGKKIITTNPKVLEAEFYHPNNFFILTKDNYGDMAAFLEAPYVPIANAIITKYSFSEWLRHKIYVQ